MAAVIAKAEAEAGRKLLEDPTPAPQALPATAEVPLVPTAEDLRQEQLTSEPAPQAA